MKNSARLPALCILPLIAAFHFAQAADWKMDAAGSRLEFIASFEKAAAPGVFKEFDARMRFDPDKPAGSSLDVTIKVTSADMNSSDVNKAIRGAEWFDFSGHPQAEFHAADIRRVESNRYLARGTLSLKGVRLPVEVPFAWTGAADAATMEGELTLKRGDFAIGTGEWTATDTIGAEVRVRFKVKLRKAG
jgi:polyisoprenoid-binding protein YceI